MAAPPRPDAVETARRLVTERFPDAVQAWLAGSVVRDEATATSDLDITVLREEGEVFRESLTYDGWPVELFVHTAATVRWFVARDTERRRPSMAHLVATGVPLLASMAGSDLQAECRAVLDAGPPPLEDDDLRTLRYGLTDLLDDLADAPTGPLRTAVALAVWGEVADLALAAGGCWTGAGKWRVRHLRALDARDGSHLADDLDAGLRLALDGDPGPLTRIADGVLDRVGGRLWAGFRLTAPPLE